MSACKTEVVYEDEGFVLTQCRDCGRIGMLHGQCMLAFDFYGFRSFFNYINSMDFEHNKLPFFDGVDRVIIETYHPDIQFCLDEFDFFKLKAFLVEGEQQFSLLQEIRSL